MFSLSISSGHPQLMREWGYTRRRPTSSKFAIELVSQGFRLLWGFRPFALNRSGSTKLHKHTKPYSGAPPTWGVVPQKRTVSGAVRGPEVVLGEYKVTARGTEPHWTSWPLRMFMRFYRRQYCIHWQWARPIVYPALAAILASVRTKYVLP